MRDETENEILNLFLFPGPNLPITSKEWGGKKKLQEYVPIMQVVSAHHYIVKRN